MRVSSDFVVEPSFSISSRGVSIRRAFYWRIRNHWPLCLHCGLSAPLAASQAFAPAGTTDWTHITLVESVRCALGGAALPEAHGGLAPKEPVSFLTGRHASDVRPRLHRRRSPIASRSKTRRRLKPAGHSRGGRLLKCVCGPRARGQREQAG
jgi:hypothetical protein